MISNESTLSDRTNSVVMKRDAMQIKILSESAFRNCFDDIAIEHEINDAAAASEGIFGDELNVGRGKIEVDGVNEGVADDSREHASVAANRVDKGDVIVGHALQMLALDGIEVIET